jgi:hypothetical protein
MTLSVSTGAALIALILISGVRAETKTESLDRLVRAYPEALSRHDGRYIFWRDGTAMTADDGVDDKPFEDLLRNASIVDQLRLSYPTGSSPRPN